MKNRLNLSFLISILIVISSSITYAKNVLIIGDSHSCGSFGVTLAKSLTKSGDTIDLFCAVSSSPYHWVQGVTPAGQICNRWSSTNGFKPCLGTGKIPNLESIVYSAQYENVIVALGTNSLGSTQVDSNYAALIKGLSSKIKSCVWIGPPHLRPDQAKGFSIKSLQMQESNLDSFYNSLTKTVSATCKVLDSRPMTAINTSGGHTVDGVHRSKTSGVAWAKGMAVRLDTYLNANSELAKPSSDPQFAK